MMNIINMTLKNKIGTLKNLIEMRQMTLNDPNFDIKKSSDTLQKNLVFFVISIISILVN